MSISRTVVAVGKRCRLFLRPSGLPLLLRLLLRLEREEMLGLRGRPLPSSVRREGNGDFEFGDRALFRPLTPFFACHGAS